MGNIKTLEQIKRPCSSFEKAFYPNHGKNSSKMACKWIEYEAKQRGIHIHHDLCGHGGERFINNNGVDGFIMNQNRFPIPWM